MTRWLAYLLLTCMLAACASAPENLRFRLELDPRLETKRLTWPPVSSDEVPRYFYAGELVGEPNFAKREAETGSLSAFMSAVTGFLFGEAKPLVMARPQSGMVAPDGRIFVTDLARSGIFVFDESNGNLKFWERAEVYTDFVSPVGVAAGPDGQILVADADLGLVARLSADGTPLEPIGKGILKRPTGLAYDASAKRIYVTDTPEHTIKVFDEQGQFVSSIGSIGEGASGLNLPTYLSLRGTRLYATDTLNARVQIFSTRTGNALGQIGKRGPYLGNMVRPKGVATDSEHNIYVVESNHDYLLIYNQLGEFLMAIGGNGEAPGNFHLPAGVWTDSRNRIFVADTLNSRVSVFQFLGGDSGSPDE
jgi:DNA-binding beta-propeller fold protein YncE